MLILCRLIHLGTPQTVPGSSISVDCAELLQNLFCVLFQITCPQRPEILRGLVVDESIKVVGPWKAKINMRHNFKTGGTFPSLELTLTHQTGTLAVLLINYGVPVKAGLSGIANKQYLVTTADGGPFTASAFAIRFKHFTAGTVDGLAYTPNAVSL